MCPSKQDPNTYVQAGIVAWGIGCGENNVPGVYADVSKAVCWIDQQLTCHRGAQTGDYNSYFGYTSDKCGAWHADKITEIRQKMEGNNSKYWQSVMSEYSKCNVTWGQEQELSLDINNLSNPRR